MAQYVSGTAIVDTFIHLEGTTGLVNGDFTKQAVLNGVADAETITVTEIGSGRYSMSFTPDANGVWFIDVYETSNSENRFYETYVVRDAEATSSEISGLNDLSAAQVKAELDTAESNIITAVSAKPTAAEVAAAVLASTIETQGSITLQQFCSCAAAGLFGVTANGGLTFKTPNGGATRITATVNDSNERLTISLNPSS